VEEEQLRADQPGEVGAGSRCGAGVLDRREVGADADLDAVLRHGWLRGPGPRGVAPPGCGRRPLPEVRHLLGRRRDDHDAAAAVDGDRGAGRHRQEVGAGGDHGRDAERAHEDRAVRRRAAAGERHGGDAVGVEPGRVRRGQVGGHQDGAAGWLRGVRGKRATGRPRQTGGDLRADRADIGGPPPLVRVVEGVEGGRDRGDSVPPRGDGSPATVDLRPGLVEEIRIVEEQQVGVEHPRRTLPRNGGGPVPGQAEFLLDVRDRLSQPGLLGAGVPGAGVAGAGVRVVRDDVGRGREPGGADGDAGCGGQRARSDPGGRGDVGAVEVPEPALGEVEDGADGAGGIGPGGGDRDDVTLLRAERRHPGEAARGHRIAPGREVAEANVSVERTDSLDERGRWPGVQAVGPGDLEAPSGVGGDTRRSGLRRC
jgi:hypothetical protein